MLPIPQIALNTLLFTGVFAVAIWFSLWWNVRLWLHDFPQPMQDALPPLSVTEKRDQKILLILLIFVLCIVPILFNLQLRALMGSAFTFAVAYGHTWLMLQAANLYDAIGIDLLISYRPPKFAVPAGSEPYLHLLLDKDMHLRNFIKGLIGMSVAALIPAVITMLI